MPSVSGNSYSCDVGRDDARFLKAHPFVTTAYINGRFDFCARNDIFIYLPTYLQFLGPIQALHGECEAF